MGFRIFLHKVFRMRIVNAGLVSMASVSTEQRVFSKCNLQYSDHGYFFLDPMPSVEELDEYYSTYYWDPTKKARKDYGANTRDFLHYSLLNDYVPQVLASEKVFLNFGAGHGGVSNLCWLAGMEVINVEPSSLPDFYKTRWNTFSDIADVEDSSVDLIYSSHSLEHVQDIAKIQKEFQRVIKQDGLLFFEVPNADNATIGPKNSKVDIPHTYYFQKDFFNKWFTDVILCEGFERESWKKLNIVEDWRETMDEEGLVVRALGRIR